MAKISPQRSTNVTKSMLFKQPIRTGYVSERYGSSDRTAAVEQQLLVDSRMSRRCQRRYKLANANRAFCRLGYALSDIQRPNKMQLSENLNPPISSSSFPARTSFGFESIQSCNSILYFDGTRRIPNTRHHRLHDREKLATYLCPYSVELHRPHTLNHSFLYEKEQQSHCFYMRVGLSPLS